MPRVLSRPACLRQAEQVARKACASEPGWADCLKQVLPTIERRMCPAPPPRAAPVRDPARAACRPKCAKPNRPAGQSLAECIAACVREIDRPGAPGCPPADERTTIITPQARDPARYAVVSADDLVASHDPMSFTPDPRYPVGVQERQYHADKNEQGKVHLGAQRLDPPLLLHRAPTPTDGPPIATERGFCVLGGNGRSMMMKRAYGTDQPGAAQYREELACRAGEFGLSSEQVRATPNPVLVRLVDGTSCDSPPETLARAVRRYNESMTNALDTMALAVSKARQLSPGSVALFGSLLSGDKSLREQMAEEPRAFLRALENDGIVTAQNRTQYSTPSGGLTEYARGEIEGMFLGRVLRSADRIGATSPSLLRKVERAVPYLTTVDARNPAGGQTETLVQAVDLLNEASNRGEPLEFVLSQQSMFGSGPQKASPQVVALARVLASSGPNQIRDRFKAWAQAADFDPAQSTLGGTPPTAEEAFRLLIEGARAGRERPLFVGTGVKQDGALARIVAVYDSRDPRGLKPGQARIEFVSGARRGERVVLDAQDVGEVV